MVNRAVILAGGLGTRLHPLTINHAKCMLEIRGKPLLEHIIDYLKNCGITQIIVALGNKKEQIMDYFGDGSAFGIELQYSIEEVPLGTAGAFRKVGEKVQDTTVIMQGDNITNFPLDKLTSFHNVKHALVSIAVTTVENTEDYGVVVLDSQSKVMRFEEKPSNSFANLVNAGIYVVEPSIMQYIPQDKEFDFSRDLFPLLLRKELPFYALELKGYWFDIGTLENYRRAKKFLENITNSVGQ